MTTNCSICKKRIFIKFVMSAYNLNVRSIATAINVSDSTVRKHIDGIRNCPQVDIYIAECCLGIKIKDLVC